jgi:hypothetical protein
MPWREASNRTVERLVHAQRGHAPNDPLGDGHLIEIGRHAFGEGEHLGRRGEL